MKKNQQCVPDKAKGLEVENTLSAPKQKDRRIKR